MADVDAAFVQQILDVAQGEWEPDVEHDGQSDHLGRRLEIAKWRALGHVQKGRVCCQTNANSFQVRSRAASQVAPS